MPPPPSVVHSHLVWLFRLHLGVRKLVRRKEGPCNALHFLDRHFFVPM